MYFSLSLVFGEMETHNSLNGTLSVLLCNLFRFHKEAVPALWLEFSRSCTGGVRGFYAKMTAK